jgi:glycosyltransferase involved in cell wall biosynthesis
VLTPFNLEPRKNLLSLVRAMADVRRTHADVRLVLYGRAAVTPERQHQFERDVRELGLQDAVVLTGPVSDGELGFLHQRAVLFVFPSLYEGFGLPALDAMAAGLCTVARNQSAMAEVLGDAGVQIETADPIQLAATIRSLLDNPKRRADLGHAGRRRSSQFTSDLMARRTLAVYEKALVAPDA